MRTETEHASTRKQYRIVLASSFVGNVAENYDFVLYGLSASVVFTHVFFNQLNYSLGLFVSFSTLAVGYVLRPLGGLVWGHFGDRFGRKPMLTITIIAMGIVTLLIGLLPGTDKWGIMAPIALVVLRIIQGIIMSGEYAGASLMAVENAPGERRGMAAALTSSGGPAGAVLATLAVSGASAISGDGFLDWGWRLPFYGSVLVVAVGIVLRLKMVESPVFLKNLERRTAEPAAKDRPVKTLFTKFPTAIVIAFGVTIGYYMWQGLITVWGITVAVDSGVSREGVLNVKALSAVLLIAVTYGAGRLSDRIGRRTMLIIGAVAGIIGAYPILLLLHSGSLLGVALAMILGNSLIEGMLYGPVGSFIAEQFPTSVRYSGTSFAYQSAAWASGFTPMIAVALMATGNGASLLVAAYVVLIMLVTIVCAKLGREGTTTNIEDDWDTETPSQNVPRADDSMKKAR